MKGNLEATYLTKPIGQILKRKLMNEDNIIEEMKIKKAAHNPKNDK